MVAKSKNAAAVQPHPVEEAIDRLQRDFDLGVSNRAELVAMAAADPQILPAVREVLEVVAVDDHVAPGITIWVEEPEGSYPGKVWVQGALRERNVQSWDHVTHLQIKLMAQELGSRGIYKVGLYLV